MALILAILGFILLVAHATITYRMRKEVNAGIRAPFERIPAVMSTWSEFRLLRSYRQSYPTSWLWHAYYLTAIGFALCFLGAIESLKK